MSNKKVFKNYIYNTAYQILLVIAPLITSPYISRVLGATGVGVYNYAYSVVTYFALFGTLGSALYGQREVAYHQDDKNELSKLFWEIVIFRLILILLATGFYCFTIVRTSDYPMVAILVIGELIAAAVDVSWIFQGLEDFKRIVLRNVVVKVLGIALVFILVKGPNDVNLYTICCTLPTLIGNLSLWPYLKRVISFVKGSKLSLMSNLRPMVSLFLPQVAIQIYAILDKTMIGDLAVNIDEVGYYTYSQHIVKTILQIVTSLGTVMLPAMANSFSKGQFDEIRNATEKSTSFTCLFCFPLIFGLIGTADNFVEWFYGPGFDKTALLIKITSPIILFIGISTITGRQVLLPIKRQRDFTLSVTFGALINFAINYFLIPKYNAIGAAIGTIVAEFIVMLIQILALRKEFSFSKYVKVNIKYFLCSIVMFIPVCYMGRFLDGIIGTLTQTILGIVVYFGLLLLVKDPFFMGYLEKVLKKGKAGEMINGNII